MIKCAACLIVLYGAAHLAGALTIEGAGQHSVAWFTGKLWREDLSSMSAAGSALWLTLDSFAIPLILLGLTILWLDRQGVTPPAFIGWILGVWTVIDAMILLFTPWPLMMLADALLLIGIHRARRQPRKT